MNNLWGLEKKKNTTTQKQQIPHIIHHICLYLFPSFKEVQPSSSSLLLLLLLFFFLSQKKCMHSHHSLESPSPCTLLSHLWYWQQITPTPTHLPGNSSKPTTSYFIIKYIIVCTLHNQSALVRYDNTTSTTPHFQSPPHLLSNQQSTILLTTKWVKNNSTNKKSPHLFFYQVKKK